MLSVWLGVYDIDVYIYILYAYLFSFIDESRKNEFERTISNGYVICRGLPAAGVVLMKILRTSARVTGHRRSRARVQDGRQPMTSLRIGRARRQARAVCACVRPYMCVRLWVRARITVVFESDRARSRPARKSDAISVKTVLDVGRLRVLKNVRANEDELYRNNARVFA